MKYFISILIVLIGKAVVIGQSASLFELEKTEAIFSNILQEDRGYWLSLPPSYYKPEWKHKEYPILLVLDGDIHFEAVSAMVHYLSGDKTRSWKIPEMIVIGIKNVDRRRDYTPDKVITVRPNNSGGGENFRRFVEEELIPQVKDQYRTLPYYILMGHSLGGLLTAHTYMQEETVFKAFIAIDPSFGTWDEPTMDDKLDRVTSHSFSRYLYLATANWDKRNINNRDRHIRWFEGLNRKFTDAFPGKLEYFENENHSSVPLIAFLQGISTIFDDYGISYRSIKNINHLQNHFQLLSDRLSFHFPPPENLTNQLGYQMLRNGGDEVKLAIEYFELNVQNYPTSSNAFDSLAEGYEALGDMEKALVNYQKSLELNPNNEHARIKISELSEK
jgi:predicted alpha/beta superfamily hydrolase